MKEPFTFNYFGREVILNLYSVPKNFERAGLMFTSRKKAKPLLFNFKNPNESIHSLFVFFPFIAIWLNKNKEVLDLKVIKPFKFNIKPTEEYEYLIEIPLNASEESKECEKEVLQN